MEWSFFFFGNFFLLSFNFPVFTLIGLFVLFVFSLILVVLCLKSSFGGLIDFAPFLADDFGELCNFSRGIFSFHILIDFSSEEKESGEWLFGRCRLNYKLLTFESLSFLPILYRILNTKAFYFYKCIIEELI